jgi:NNP family nitrate/nitrite transporter-like MFS transporter
VFQLVPLRFQREIGVITGLVGGAGGLGGFFLPSLLGLLKDLIGTYASGFVVLTLVCIWGMSLLIAVSGAWRLTWAAELSPSRGV